MRSGFKNYHDYIQAISPRLPCALRLLGSGHFNLHDAVIKSITMHEEMLVIKAISPNLFQGECVGSMELKMTYAKVHHLDTAHIQAICHMQKIEILENVLDMLSEQQFSHKMLLANQKEFSVLFESFSLEIKDILYKRCAGVRCKVRFK